MTIINTQIPKFGYISTMISLVVEIRRRLFSPVQEMEIMVNQLCKLYLNEFLDVSYQI